MPKDIDIVEALVRASSEEWITCIASRLEVMKGYLAQEPWSKGVDPYLRALLGNQLKKFLKEGGNADYVRGFSSALQLMIALPSSVDEQIKREEQKGKSTGPQPYTG
jgi:hypothetical protein